MSVLDSSLRRNLERTIVNARNIAENAAAKALKRIGVDQQQPPSTLSAEERPLHRELRAQLNQVENFRTLVEQCGYEQWHLILFARFLAENDLLIHPEMQVAVSLEDCEDEQLQRDSGATDAYDLAARYATQMLPAVFRPDDALLKVKLAPEDRIALEKLVKDLPEAVFKADDSLGWTYQFWQKERKDEVNKAEESIEGSDISAVTQLFTEHYMVRFLLENTVGAWWLHVKPDSKLAPSWEYYKPDIPHDHSLSPKGLEDATILDPCCGSGHFLVDAFLLFQSMYVEQGLSAKDAGDAAIKNNIRGLELDPRCTQIAAFNVAFAAWRHGGYRSLPEIQIACSGQALRGSRSQWEKLAQGEPTLSAGMAVLHDTFSKASNLGSLIHPSGMFDVAMDTNIRQFTLDSMPDTERQKMLDLASQVQWKALQALLDRALESESAKRDEDHYTGVRAQGVAQAAHMLSERYSFVITNPPFMAVTKGGQDLKDFCAENYHEAKKDLATCFIERLRDFAKPGAEYAVVCPQNWLFLGSDKKFRQKLLKEQRWLAVIRFGEGAFESSAAAGAFTANLIFANRKPGKDDNFFGLDASAPKTAAEKAELLRGATSISMSTMDSDEVEDSSDFASELTEVQI